MSNGLPPPPRRARASPLHVAVPDFAPTTAHKINSPSSRRKPVPLRLDSNIEASQSSSQGPQASSPHVTVSPILVTGSAPMFSSATMTESFSPSLQAHSLPVTPQAPSLSPSNSMHRKEQAQFILAVDKPLDQYDENSHLGADTNNYVAPSRHRSLKEPPAINPRTSSVPPPYEIDFKKLIGATLTDRVTTDNPNSTSPPTQSASSSRTGSPVSNQRIHYLRAAKSASRLSPSETAVRSDPPTLQHSRERSAVTPPELEIGSIAPALPVGLGIMNTPGLAQPLQPGENIPITLIPSKQLPPVPLSRSTTGVPGGPAPMPGPHKTNTKYKTHPPKKVKEEFSVDQLVDPLRLWEASHCYVQDELGRKRRFGEFFDGINMPPMNQETKENADAKGASLANIGRSPSLQGSRAPSPSMRSIRSEKSTASAKEKKKMLQKCGGEEWNVPGRKTVAFYIRHFWCGQCQDFTFASLSLLDPVAINAAGLNVVIISNGNWRIIKRYRELFRCPYPIYVDESRALYEKMGMVLITGDFGTFTQANRAAYNQRTVPVQVVTAIKKGLFDMPLRNPGKLNQLGGEFILGPGLTCEFAHRMSNTSNHMEAYDVLKIAGCENPTTAEQMAMRLADDEIAQVEQLQREEDEWREGRRAEIERIQQKKAARRGLAFAKDEPKINFNIYDRRLSVPTEADEDLYVYEDQLGQHTEELADETDGEARPTDERTGLTPDQDIQLRASIENMSIVMPS